MSQVGPTKGPWIAASAYSTVAGIPVVAQDGFRVCNTSLPGLPKDFAPRILEQLANARLIAEAGTVYSESGLSPRALLEQRDAALAERDAISGDIRWAVNYLLEEIAKKFEANDTWDIWRSDAAALVREHKHNSPLVPSQPPQDLHKVEREDAGWLPIESAPDAPMQVEFYFGLLGSELVFKPYRDERRGLGFWDGHCWRYCGTGHKVFELAETPAEQQPTHWRPLPAPPAAARGE